MIITMVVVVLVVCVCYKVKPINQKAEITCSISAREFKHNALTLLQHTHTHNFSVQGFHQSYRSKSAVLFVLITLKLIYH